MEKSKLLLNYWKKMFNKILEKYMFYDRTNKIIIYMMNDLDECCKKKKEKRK